jgi:hypothetical protein
LIIEVGRETETITVTAGGFLAAPPGLAHFLRVGSDRAARWLTIHAPDGGLPASNAISSSSGYLPQDKAEDWWPASPRSHYRPTTRSPARG